ncbi:hypothetical protein LCGC14_1116490 [marine sediment metagenome]|uniref:Glycosyl hydrolase family 32 N-terminal domain-containing protein n=1 Tax=marine sediment metagenome TaxID=412755 RepID=A0A0F9MA04_9ZZZZ
MNIIQSFLKKFFSYLNYYSFKIGKFKKLNLLRNELSLELLLNKHLANYRNIISPFKETLPLIKYKKNPILTAGNPGDWDEAGIYEPYILYNGKNYLLYYESRTYFKKMDWQIGVAIAEKIIGPWEKHPDNPILRYTLNEGDYDKQYVADPCVIYHNGKYHMWFDMHDSKTSRIGKAYSSDGIIWEKYKKDGKTAAVLDLGKKNQWDGDYVHCPEIYLWNDKFHILYGAKGVGHLDYDTGLAIQKDDKGELFYKWGQVTTDEMLGKKKIISRLQPGVILNGVIIAGLRVKLSKKIERIFIVFSDDGGKSWNKLTDPILKPGSLHDWDSMVFYGPNCWIISENKLWSAYLGGSKHDFRSLGLAYMKIPKIK